MTPFLTSPSWGPLSYMIFQTGSGRGKLLPACPTTCWDRDSPCEQNHIRLKTIPSLIQSKRFPELSFAILYSVQMALQTSKFHNLHYTSRSLRCLCDMLQKYVLMESAKLITECLSSCRDKLDDHKKVSHKGTSPQYQLLIIILLIHVST